MYTFGSGTTIPAISRKIFESELIEKYHWLPQDIKNIPYKALKEHLFIQKQKNELTQTHKNIQQAKTKSKAMGSKKFVREL